MEDEAGASCKGEKAAMKLYVSLDPVRVTRTLDEFESVAIGRFPPITGSMQRIEIGNDEGFGYLSRHALTITNGNDRLTVENRQRPGGGRVLITKNGVMTLVHPEGASVRPVPTDTLLKVELFDGLRRELTIHIKATGEPSQKGGALTRETKSGSIILEDWIIAINAVQCARLAGEKPTARSAKRYFLKHKDKFPTNTGAFEKAYATAGTLLLEDPKAGHYRLLDVAERYIDAQLVQRMTENVGA